MNVRNVLKTYSLLRQLTDDESALLETLRGLSDADRESLVTTLSPEKPVGKKPGKKPAAATAAATRQYDHCLRCGTTKRDSSHKDQARADYHEFQSRKSAHAQSLADAIQRAPKEKVAKVSDDGNSSNDEDGPRAESVWTVTGG